MWSVIRGGTGELTFLVVVVEVGGGIYPTERGSSNLLVSKGAPPL